MIGIRISFPVTLFLVIASFCSSPTLATQTGTVLITVSDEKGRDASDATVYVYETRSGASGTYECDGSSIELHLSPGIYRIYSASLLQKGDHLARLVSPEARMDVLEGSYESLILSLSERDSALTEVSERTLKKLGIDRDALARLN